MNIWDKAINVTPEMAQKLIEEQCSYIVNDIKILGSGYDNTAFLVNNEIVFRFPHRESAQVLMENEIALLPSLAARITFSLPRLQFIGKPTHKYPYSFAGYPILQGSLVSDFGDPLLHEKAYAKKLAQWLKELHSLPVLDTDCATLKGDNAWRLDVDHRIQRVKETLVKYHAHFESCGFDIEELALGMIFFKDLDTSIASKHYVHGDLYAKHVLIDQSMHPSGIIDWGDAHIGHPALDLGIAFMIFTDNTRAAFFDAYGAIDQQWLEIALFRSYFHPILSLPYFISEGDTGGASWAKAALLHSKKIIFQKKIIAA